MAATPYLSNLPVKSPRRILRGMQALLFLTVLASGESRLQYVTFGPMVHWNFGKGVTTFSVAVEAAFWSFPSGDVLFDGGAEVPGDGELGFGIDLGLEWESGKIRAYAEPQLGIAPVGIALGPVVEWNRESHALALGTQGSLWGNLAFLGADIRGRMIGGKKHLAPGCYLKIPIPI